MGNESLTHKQLRVTITLGSGDFGAANGSGNTVSIQGKRVIAHVEHAGGAAMTEGTFRIYGLPQSLMNQLTTLSWRALSFVRNTIVVEAGDSLGLAQIFKGQIINAWADYQSQPDVYLNISAQTGFYDQVNPIAPVSVQGAADVATLMKSLANKMGLAFENNGVSGQLSNPYFDQSAIEQARAVASHANIDLYIEGDTLAICPKGVPRGGQTPLISPQSGLVGYPTFDKQGTNFRCLFNPALRFGGTVEIDTSVTNAKGVWRIYNMSHDLESERPGGAWFTNVRATEPQNGPVLAR